MGNHWPTKWTFLKKKPEKNNEYQLAKMPTYRSAWSDQVICMPVEWRGELILHQCKESATV